MKIKIKGITLSITRKWYLMRYKRFILLKSLPKVKILEDYKKNEEDINKIRKDSKKHNV